MKMYQWAWLLFMLLAGGEALVRSYQNGISYCGGKYVAEAPAPLPKLIIKGSNDEGKEPVQPVQLVYLMDWTCESCRALHEELVKLSEASPLSELGGREYVITLLPGASDEKGRRIHQTVLTAQWADPMVYEVLVHEISQGELVDTETAAQDRALELTGQRLWLNKLRAYVKASQYAQALAQQQFAHNAEQLEAQTISFPQLISTESVFSHYTDTVELYRFLQQAAREQDASQKAITPEVFTLAGAETTDRPKNGARVSFTQTTQTSAPITMGQSATATYSYTNTGTENLIIYGVQTDCGCTKASGWEKSVPPGETGELTITYDSRGKSPRSPHTLKIWLLSSASNRDQVSKGTLLTLIVPIESEE